MLELFLIHFGYKQKISLFTDQLRSTQKQKTLELSNFATRGESTLLVLLLLLLSSWFLSQNCRYFYKSRSAFWWNWRFKHRLPCDPPSWNRIRKELWELVIPICDWFILIWSQGPVPTNSSHEAFLRTSRRNLSQKFKPDWIRGISRKDKILVSTSRFCRKE